MKKAIVILAAMAILFVSGTAAVAADTANVAVNATVVGACKFNSGGTIDFTLDPSIGGDVNGAVTQPQFWCTKNASYTITDDNGQNEVGTTHRMKHASLSEFIEYTFTYTATGTGAGKNSPITMNIASTVAEAQYANASAGSYSDTVTLTINP